MLKTRIILRQRRELTGTDSGNRDSELPGIGGVQFGSAGPHSRLFLKGDARLNYVRLCRSVPESATTLDNAAVIDRPISLAMCNAAHAADNNERTSGLEPRCRIACASTADYPCFGERDCKNRQNPGRSTPGAPACACCYP